MKKLGVNSKRLFNNIVGAFVIKGIGLLINFFTIPMYMKYFSSAGILGVWYTILSILSWILTFDLGIGNGLRNHLVGPLVRKDKKQINIFLSSAYIILGFVSLIMAFLGTIVICIFNWNQIFNISEMTISLKVLRLALIITFMGVCVQFFLKLILSVLNAMEKTALSNAVMLVSNIINLIYLIVYNTGDDAEKLLRLSVVYSLSINLPLVICTIIIFSTIFKGNIPKFRHFKKSFAFKILNLGGSFFFIQILFMILTSSNEFFISNVFGAEKVVEFQIYNKIFYTFVTLYSLITNPIWSAVTRAYKEKRLKWINKIFNILSITAAAGALGTLGLGLCFQWVVNLWLRDKAITISFHFVIAFVFYISTMFFVFAVNSIANGLEALKPQIICFALAVIIKIIIIIGFKFLWNDWSIVIWVNTITLIPYVIWQYIDLKKRLHRKMKSLKSI